MISKLLNEVTVHLWFHQRQAYVMLSQWRPIKYNVKNAIQKQFADFLTVAKNVEEIEVNSKYYVFLLFRSDSNE